MSNKVLYLCLGLPTWCLINGTFGIMFTLVDTQPESYNISSFITVSITMGNIVALYMGLYCKEAIHSRTAVLIRFILSLGLVTSVLLALFWSSVINGVSAPLFILCFFAGVCASTSNILLFTFVPVSASAAAVDRDSKEKEQEQVKDDGTDDAAAAAADAGNAAEAAVAAATTMLATGMGLGSMTSGLMALCIGSLAADGAVLRAAVGWYYAVFAAMYALALWALHQLSPVAPSGVLEEGRAGSGRGSLVAGAGSSRGGAKADNRHQQYKHGSCSSSGSMSGGRDRVLLGAVVVGPMPSVTVSPPLAAHHVAVRQSTSSSSALEAPTCDDAVANAAIPALVQAAPPLSPPSPSPRPYEDTFLSVVSAHAEVAPLLGVLFGVAAVGVGVFPSLISTTCAQFASSGQVLLYATTAACIFDPISRGVTQFVPLTSFRSICVAFLLCMLGTLAMIMLLVLPAAGADLPLYHREYGGIIPALLYVLGLSMYGYLTTCVFLYFNHNKSRLLGRGLDRGTDQRHRVRSVGSAISRTDSFDAEAEDELRLLTADLCDNRGGGGAEMDGDAEALEAKQQSIFRMGSVAAQAGAFCGTVVCFTLILTRAL